MKHLICTLLLLAYRESIYRASIDEYCGLESGDDVRELTPIVPTKAGKVQGYYQDVGNGAKVEVYEGIRYGRANRFEESTFAAPWTGVYEATSPRDSCPQFGGGIVFTEHQMVNMNTSEDCLFLNVWAPAEKRLLFKRPVMVWIHGGGFETDTIFSPVYNASQLAAQGDVVVVAIEYRLGPLGFLTGGNVTPNLGLHDTILALKWVQENIKSFGGDPNRVTIFGQSSGSMLVGSLVLSPLAQGLFERAIMQSGSPTTAAATVSRGEALNRTLAFANKLNCSSGANVEQIVECIKGKPIQELQAASANDYVTNLLFTPVYGDELLPLHPKTAVKTGKFNQVDLIYGVTRDEGTFAVPIFVPMIDKMNLTEQLTRGIIGKIMAAYGQPSIANEVADYYLAKFPNPTPDDLKLVVSEFYGDLAMVCPTILFGEEYSKHTIKQTYAYRLMQEAVFPGAKQHEWMGVRQGQDLFFLFLSDVLKYSPAQYEVSQNMIQDWTTFARRGAPTAHWQPAVDRARNDFTTRHLNIEANNFKMVSGYFKETCDNFWKPKIFA